MTLKSTVTPYSLEEFYWRSFEKSEDVTPYLVYIQQESDLNFGHDIRHSELDWLSFASLILDDVVKALLFPFSGFR